VRGDRRGATHAGHRAPVPDSSYDPPPPVAGTDTGLDVPFVGEDGRRTVFRVGRLPLPGWHAPLAEAFAERVGPAGTRRTLSSAAGSWSTLGRFLRFLDDLPQPPTPRELTAAQVDAYLRHRVRSPLGQRAWEELIELRQLFRQPSMRDLVDGKVGNYLARRVDKTGGRLPGRSGYSDGELARLGDAARADVAAIRDRIDAGEALLASWRADPASISGEDAVTAALLEEAAETGVIPRLPGGRPQQERNARTALAQRLFVTRTDREPLLVLLAAVTGRNSETLKELPAEHRVLDGAAVELRVIKRRQGPRRWFDTVTWEIGPPHRELHTPGGLYLLLHRLMARGRAISGSQTLCRSGATRIRVASPLSMSTPTHSPRSSRPRRRRWRWVSTGSAPASRCAAPAPPAGTCPPRHARTPSGCCSLRRTLAWFIARQPGGSIAGAIQYRHLSVQMFEGYAGTSDSGFRAEVESEQALARGEHLLAMVDAHEHTLAGPAATEAERRLAEFDEHARLDNQARFAGTVLTDPRRLCGSRMAFLRRHTSMPGARMTSRAGRGDSSARKKSSSGRSASTESMST
jgi:hypothetical protein